MDGVAPAPETVSQFPPEVVATAVLKVTELIAPGAVTWTVCAVGLVPATVPERVSPETESVSVGEAVTLRVTGIVSVGFAAPAP